ncbi:hypothetical protein PAPYR_4287 [Paratrimastix pyriformis]|uniref:Uncharacterized protein n=1 Tax=Paratrimastix pyriformis TaxID=342808 RepID=A0ABQ8UK19_9EUKA|nr:hypothetical protein PAPYR_4287 [Paratrimastix pyriformis]
MSSSEHRRETTSRIPRLSMSMTAPRPSIGGRSSVMNPPTKPAGKTTAPASSSKEKTVPSTPNETRMRPPSTPASRLARPTTAPLQSPAPRTEEKPAEVVPLSEVERLRKEFEESQATLLQDWQQRCHSKEDDLAKATDTITQQKEKITALEMQVKELCQRCETLAADLKASNLRSATYERKLQQAGIDPVSLRPFDVEVASDDERYRQFEASITALEEAVVAREQTLGNTLSQLAEGSSLLGKHARTLLASSNFEEEHAVPQNEDFKKARPEEHQSQPQQQPQPAMESAG